MLKQNSPIPSAHMAAKQACAHEICVQSFMLLNFKYSFLQDKKSTIKMKTYQGSKTHSKHERLITDSE